MQACDLSAREREKYAALWSGVAQYGVYAPGEHYAPLFAEVFPQRGRVLDAGCGSGKGGLALKALGYDVTLCDLTPDGLTDEARVLPFHESCLWHRQKGRYDYAFCCDVLEHIQPQFTMLVVDQLLRVVTTGVFLSVSLVQDGFGAWIGEPLHLTVEPFVWWRDALGDVGHIVEARDLIENAVFVVTPW